jgi:hypothetical protein
MPSSLHEQAAEAAAREGVSLNQFVCGLLAAAVGWQPSPGERASRERRRPMTNEEKFQEIWGPLLRS